MKISCNVVQDLMQPYAEGILSDDSIKLVDEHVSECEGCREKLEEISSINQNLDGIIRSEEKLTGTDYNEDAVTFKEFRKWINFHRAIAIVVTLVVAVTICFGAVYYAEVYQSYIPFEEAGITVDQNGIIYTDRAYQTFFGEEYVVETTRDKAHYIMFIYLTSSFRSRHFEKPGELTIITDPTKVGGQVLGEGDVMLDTDVIAVYYASKNFIRKDKSFNYKRELLIPPGVSETERQAMIDELMADSVLLWRKG
jgi:hypothetical protein